MDSKSTARPKGRQVSNYKKKKIEILPSNSKYFPPYKAVNMLAITQRFPWRSNHVTWSTQTLVELGQAVVRTPKSGLAKRGPTGIRFFCMFSVSGEKVSNWSIFTNLQFKTYITKLTHISELPTRNENHTRVLVIGQHTDIIPTCCLAVLPFQIWRNYLVNEMALIE